MRSQYRFFMLPRAQPYLRIHLCGWGQLSPVTLSPAVVHVPGALLLGRSSSNPTGTNATPRTDSGTPSDAAAEQAVAGGPPPGVATLVNHGTALMRYRWVVKRSDCETISEVPRFPASARHLACR